MGVSIKGHLFLFVIPLSYATHSNRTQGAMGAPAESKQSCLVPKTSKNFAVLTDGGSKNGSKTHQSRQAYQSYWGGVIDPGRIDGAVLTELNGLRGGDLYCYFNALTLLSRCGVIIDRAIKKGQTVAKFKNGETKPPEATASIHKELGATYASGAGSSLAGVDITAQPVKLSEADHAMITKALTDVRSLENYDEVNQLIQETAAKYSKCLAFQLNDAGGNLPI